MSISSTLPHLPQKKGKIMSFALTASPPGFASIRASAKPPRQNQNVKTQKVVGGATSDAAAAAITKRVFSGKKKDPQWQCVKGCGACCMLDKGPDYATPEELFDDPSDVQLYRSMIGSDGWCKHYEKGTRTCSIYADRPYFCRAEPDVWQKLYGVRKKNFNKEAIGKMYHSVSKIADEDLGAEWYIFQSTRVSHCYFLSSSCRGTIEDIYGSQSEELKNYNRAIRSSTLK